MTGAYKALGNLQALKARPPTYRELGSLEGTIASIEIDGHDRPVLQIRSRVTGRSVKCVMRDGLDRIGHYEVGKVLEGLNVRAFGVTTFKGYGKPTQMEVSEIEVLGRDLETLPDIADITDER